jgi:hypothetical protein
MKTEHPITPSIELVKQWSDHWHRADDNDFDHALFISIRAARWGADQELEACCKLLELSYLNAREFLCAARRPKPPSLKERALQAMDRVDVLWATDEFGKETMDDIDAIRRALEALPD